MMTSRSPALLFLFRDDVLVPLLSSGFGALAADTAEEEKGSEGVEEVEATPAEGVGKGDEGVEGVVVVAANKSGL